MLRAYFNLLLTSYYTIVSTPTLTGHCDVDYAGDLDSWKSTPEYIFSLGSRSICWKTKKQVSVSLSTAKAEY